MSPINPEASATTKAMTITIARICHPVLLQPTCGYAVRDNYIKYPSRMLSFTRLPSHRGNVGLTINQLTSMLTDHRLPGDTVTVSSRSFHNSKDVGDESIRLSGSGEESLRTASQTGHRDR